MERSVREEARLRAGEILPQDRLERGDAGSSALRDMQGRSANLSMQGDPSQSTRAPSTRSRPCKNGQLQTGVAGAFQTHLDDVRRALSYGPSRRQHEVGDGLPGQCDRGMRHAGSHGERADERADAYRCRLHDRHNDGRNPCSLRAADALPNRRHEAVRISAAGHTVRLDADLSERPWWETIAARLDASRSQHL